MFGKLFIPLSLFVIYYLYKIYNQKNMKIILKDEKDITNQIESGLSKEDKYLGQIVQSYPEDLKP